MFVSNSRRLRRGVAGLVGLGLLTVASSAYAAPTEPTNQNVGPYCEAGSQITGAGASFARLAHENAFKPAYAADCGKGTITYNSVGSGKGRAAICRRVDSVTLEPTAFAGSDEPLTDEQKLSFEAGVCPADGTTPATVGIGGPSQIHQIPIALGAITVSYNLPAACDTDGTPVEREKLNLTSRQISDVFAGAVTNWSQVGLPCDLAITRVVREDVSGTTFAFKDYLSKRNPAPWTELKAEENNTAWPNEGTGLVRADGNSRVADGVVATSGGVGYVVLSDARAKNLTWAKVEGSGGTFNEPDLGAGPGANCEQSAAGAALPASTKDGGWHAVSITDSPAGYPICTFTYGLVYDNLVSAYAGALDSAETQTVVDYLSVAVDDLGQDLLAQSDYGRLPADVQLLAKEGIASIVGLP